MSSEIKDRLEQMNTSMDALMTLAQAYDGLFFISSVNPVTEGNSEKGYEVAHIVSHKTKKICYIVR